MALKTVIDLGEFEGAPVVRADIRITKSGDGLSKAMKVDPMLMHQGEEVYVAMRCRVAKVWFEPVDPDSDEEVVRVHVLRAGSATVVDGKVVAKAIDSQADRIRKARQAEEGVKELFDDDDEGHDDDDDDDEGDE